MFQLGPPSSEGACVKLQPKVSVLFCITFKFEVSNIYRVKTMSGKQLNLAKITFEKLKQALFILRYMIIN